MHVSVEIEIAKPREVVWETIIDIEGSKDVISGIVDVEVLTKPKAGIIGLKWKETRLMFGKEASEVMWITESKEGVYYQTRAESHGSVYISRLSLEKVNGATLLTMAFTGEAQTIPVKILSVCMSPFMKSPMKKMMMKDLEDIKKHVENTDG